MPLSMVEGNISFGPNADSALSNYQLTGDTQLSLDPSLIRQGGTSYVFSTDVVGSNRHGNIPIHCSQNELNWSSCGSVFSEVPEWVRKKVPGISGLWAPDISYFGGLYHLYYCGSTLDSQRSVIGVATNTTLDPKDPQYRWVDAGEVLESIPGDDFNALDPNIFVDTSGEVFMSYGSYWTGIKQVRIDPATGLPMPNAKPVALATRPSVKNNPIEGASLVRHGDYYYLFVSIDYCCNADFTTNDYKQSVGRSNSPEGPFIDMKGTPMLRGGGTVILEGQGVWKAPGGGTAYIDTRADDSVLVFHALKTTENGMQYLWVKHIRWQNDWPVLQ